MDRLLEGKRTRILVVLAAALVVGPGAGQSAEPEIPEPYAEPIGLFGHGLGTFERPISSKNPEAQAYFNQGFQLMFAFAKPDAVRSFREARLRDPDCAICWWGEAWAWGSYLNGPMTEKEAPHAYAAIQKALELAGEHATPEERDWIEAMAVRYVEDFDPDERREQDEAYAEAMEKLAAKYPDDLDAATLYGEALFLLEPRRGERDIHSPSVQRIHKIFEGILARDIKHPGACHLYIHATESTIDPGKGEACAEFLGDSIPGASHINHMPSHTFNEIGRWGDSVRANIQAWHSDLKSEIGEGFAIYPSHNLHMMLFAASMDGQGAIAIQAGKDYWKLTGNPMYHALTLIRFGRFDELGDVAEPDRKDPIASGMWDFAQGYAMLRLGEPEFAKAYLRRVEDARQESATFRFHDACTLLGVMTGILEGEIRRDSGDLDGAIRSFKQAVHEYDALDYDEPEPLPFAARHWLGAALLEAERFAEAEQVYRDELQDHPHNGWSLYGLQQALAGQGKKDPAVDADFEQSWARSDTWIRGSRF